ncbi:MAG: Bacterial leucyl aminopeptidase [Flavobacteriales bacterium]|nr:MAG: peptidase M28 family protein [Flavobacteriales bacterium]CAI8257453.1 MAG: Bacterial leucyl aminopeptidase [Flavobacteriales bacterium]|tara:strand:- start:3642 stop:5045 length:1404 start_codon:yes stop_codon:yes gene_type:complete
MIRLTLLFFSCTVLVAQPNPTDKSQLNQFYDLALLHGHSYEWLDYLTNRIGSRLSGSLGAERAVAWTKSELDSLGLDRVYLQPVKVPKWVRGAKEFALIETAPGVTFNVPITALGGSVATPSVGLKAPVVEVQGIEDLAKIGRENIEGKIVFYNRPMQANLISTFQAYSGCVDQRYDGAREASAFGAVGIIVRSMNLRLDDFPHTGAMSYGEQDVSKRIPAAAISTNAAEKLSYLLKLEPKLKFLFRQQCKTFPDVWSHNVIGEIKGSEFPDEVIVVGGHLDSWDLGDGAHDDGAGVVQSMEVLRLFKKSGYSPKRTIRVVLFMNEENGLRGGNAYADSALTANEKHIFALESDAGGFTPRGFSFNCSDEEFTQVTSWKPLFKPYLIHYFEQGGSGADIRPLKNKYNVLAGLRPDSQRYFDHHHAENDTFDAVNKRELELGAATMASLVFLYDKYGLVNPIPSTLKQ